MEKNQTSKTDTVGTELNTSQTSETSASDQKRRRFAQ